MQIVHTCSIVASSLFHAFGHDLLEDVIGHDLLSICIIGIAQIIAACLLWPSIELRFSLDTTCLLYP